MRNCKTVFYIVCKICVLQLYTVRYTLYSVQCTLYIIQCTLYSVQCTLYSVYCMLFSYKQHHCKLHNLQRIPPHTTALDVLFPGIYIFCIYQEHYIMYIVHMTTSLLLLYTIYVCVCITRYNVCYTNAKSFMNHTDTLYIS